MTDENDKRQKACLKQTINIIGAGKLGGALALAFDRLGFRITSLVVRNPAKIAALLSNLKSQPFVTTFERLEKIPPAEIFFITTPDFLIAPTAENLARLDAVQTAKPFVFHTSGALPAEILVELAKIGCQTASFHPLASTSDALSGAERLRNAFFAIEGDDEACKIGERLAEVLEGRSFRLNNGNKALYHAAAVMACGHFVALFDAAQTILTECGLDTNTSKEILLPLVGGTFENLSTHSNAAALTGTFARADEETMRKHLSAVAEMPDKNLLRIYQTLGRHSLKLAAEQGADAAKLDRMKSKLDET